jgi:rare lipoprotein A
MRSNDVAVVIPAKAGIQVKTHDSKLKTLDASFRWHDMKLFISSLLLSTTLILTSCSTFKGGDGKPSDFNSFDASKIPDAVPKSEPPSKYGNPKSYVALGKRYTVLKSSKGFSETGIASWYGTKFHDVRTSSGERYDMYKMTAAHKTLPLPSYVRVTNIKTGKAIIVRVNDRGPFITNRVIDLSFVAAKKIGMTGNGTAYVKVEALDPKHPEVLSAKSGKQVISSVKPHNPKVYLQLGAFGTELAANRLVRQIEQITSRTTSVIPAQSGGQTVYKVQVGPLADVSEVDALTATFKAQDLGDAFAVVR